MKQYQIEGNKLILKVKKSPLFIRIIFFTVAILFFIMPLAGMLMYISLGNGFHIGFLMGFFFFGIMGFYILRMALWNTYGRSEEHTSELQSRPHLVCRLLLEKKKTK